ncbi:MAG TPA: hypothetical protein VGE06_09115 [Flavisolibacter sp.]
MKKLLATISLLIYFVVSTGFVVSVHYCMDKLNGIEWGEADSDQCGKCGMTITDSDGCCKDEIKLMKLKVDQAIAKVVTNSFTTPAVTIVPVSFLLPLPITEYVTEEPVAHGPPLSEQDTYLQNRVFRI